MRLCARWKVTHLFSLLRTVSLRIVKLSLPPTVDGSYQTNGFSKNGERGYRLKGVFHVEKGKGRGGGADLSVVIFIILLKV